MKRCLSERAMLRVHTREGTAAEHEHLRLCADCAERYDKLVQDLEMLHHVLEAPPPVHAPSRGGLALPLRWAPLALAALALLALAGSVVWLQRPAPVQIASRAPAVSAFAADVSAALFANNSPTTTTTALVTNDAPYLQAALDAGSPCTRDRYFNGECDDQLSALLFEGE
jgi:hypothetical protein